MGNHRHDFTAVEGILPSHIQLNKGLPCPSAVFRTASKVFDNRLGFQEIAVEGVTGTTPSQPLSCDIEVQDKNKVIRFGKVDVLIEYLKKAA